MIDTKFFERNPKARPYAIALLFLCIIVATIAIDGPMERERQRIIERTTGYHGPAKHVAPGD